MTRRRSATSKARDTKQPTTLESIAESPADEIKSTPSVQTETQTPTETDPPNEETSTQNQQETMTQIQNQDEDFSSSYHRHTRLKFTISSPREFGKVERTSLRFNVDSIESYQQVISALSATLPDDLIAFGRLARTDDPVHGSLLNHESKGKQWIELNKLAINIEHSSKSSDSYQSTTSAGTIMIDEDDEDFERLIEVDRVLMRDDKGRMRTISVVMPSGSIDTSKLTSYQVNKTNGVEPTQIQTQMSSIPQTNLNSSVSQRPTTTKPRNIQEGQNVPRKSSVGANTKIPLNTQSSVVQSQGHVTKSNITRVPPPGRSTKMTRGQPPTRSNISNQHKEPSMVSYIPQDSQNQRPSIPPPPSMNTTHIPSMNNSRVPARTNPHPPRKGPEPSSKPSVSLDELACLIKDVESRTSALDSMLSSMRISNNGQSTISTNTVPVGNQHTTIPSNQGTPAPSSIGTGRMMNPPISTFPFNSQISHPEVPRNVEYQQYQPSQYPTNGNMVSFPTQRYYQVSQPMNSEVMYVQPPPPPEWFGPSQVNQPSMTYQPSGRIYTTSSQNPPGGADWPFVDPLNEF